MADISKITLPNGEEYDLKDAAARSNEIKSASISETGQIAFKNTSGETLFTLQLPLKSAQLYVPSTTNQVVAAGQYLSGAQTILGSAELKAANIKQGVEIFGVTGTYTDPNIIISSATWYLDANNILCM